MGAWRFLGLERTGGAPGHAGSWRRPRHRSPTLSVSRQHLNFDQLSDIEFATLAAASKIRACFADAAVTVEASPAFELVSDHTRRLLGKSHPIVVRMDSAFYGRGPVHAALAGGAAVSVTVRMDKRVKAAITTIGEDAWTTTIEYTDAVFDELSGRWISRAEVAEIEFTAFAAQKKTDQIPGRLVVRRIPDFNAEKHMAPGQDTPVRHLAVPRVLHHHRRRRTRHDCRRQGPPPSRGHRAGPRRPQEFGAGTPAIGVFTANAAWLVLAVMAFQPHPCRGQPDRLAAGEGHHRRRLIIVPARVATSVRRVTLHLPQAWPWETAWTALFDRVSDPPPALAA